MKTTISLSNVWATTGGASCFGKDLKPGFSILDVEAIDAPAYLPGGSAVESVVKIFNDFSRASVGSLAYR